MRRRAPIFSPAGLAVRALVLAAMFLAAHLAGLRDYTTALSGGSASESVSRSVAAFLGSAYVCLHFLFVLVAPALLIAAGLLHLGWRLRCRRP